MADAKCAVVLRAMRCLPTGDPTSEIRWRLAAQTQVYSIEADSCPGVAPMSDERAFARKGGLKLPSVDAFRSAPKGCALQHKTRGSLGRQSIPQ